jgi:hypothetical protein
LPIEITGAGNGIATALHLAVRRHGRRQRPARAFVEGTVAAVMEQGGNAIAVA